MAFNPFNWFRKHQKVFFAGLTVLCMIVFIFQFGAGDPFTRAMQWFGAGRASGQTVTSLYGKKVHEGDLQLVAERRRLASDFLFMVASESHADVCKTLLDHLKENEGTNPLAGLREIITSCQSRAGMQLLFAMRGSGSAQFLTRQIVRDLEGLEPIAIRDNVKDDPDKLAILNKVATMLGFQAWQTERIQSIANYYFRGNRMDFPRDFYFGGGSRADSTGPRIDESLDFLLWQHQADRLGIKLTDDDVIKEVIAEAAGNDKLFENRKNIDQDPRVIRFLSMPQNNRLMAKDLLDALREEFRVVMAQGALLGSEPGVRVYRTQLGVSSSPAVGTPDEFFNYFREQRTALRVDMLTLPVANFVRKVEGQPTDSMLRTLFDRYKDQEPSSFSRDPGFKEPRRIAVEILVGSPEDKFYAGLATSQLKALEQVSDPHQRIGTAIGTGAAPLLARLLVAFDPLGQEYEKDAKNDHPWFYSPNEDTATFSSRLGKLHYSSVVQPVPLTSSLASMTSGSPLVGIAALANSSFAVEVRRSMQFNLTQLLARAEPQQLLGAAALAVVTLPEPPSPAVLRPQIVAALRERLANEELTRNLLKVTEELKKFRNTRPRAAQEYLAKAAKEHHLRVMAMPAPKTRQAIIEMLRTRSEPTLATLREVFQLDDQQFMGARFENVENIANVFFTDVGTYEPRQMNRTEPRKETILLWRAEDHQARPKKYDEVRSQVEEAWKLEKARQLARVAAMELQKKINDQKLNAADALRLLKEEKAKDDKVGAIFELDGIAQAVPIREPLPMRQGYTSYRVPDDKADLFRYPPADLAKLLLVMKRPGEAVVVADQPALNFYVTVLADRSEPTVGEFRSLYARTPRIDAMYTDFITQRRDDYRKSVLEQLRREAGSVDKEGRFKVPEAIRKPETGRGDQEGI